MATFVDPYADPPQGFVDPYADPEPAPSPSYGRMAWDVAKQIPTALVTGTEAMATFPAQLAGMLPSNPRETELKALVAAQRGGGIADYLPKPQTPAGQATRNVVEFIPAAVGGSTLAIPRALGVGATAGVLSEAAGQATEGGGLEPYARAAGGIVGGVGAARAAERAAAQAAIARTTAGAKAEATQGYANFRGSDLEFHPAVGPHYATPTRASLQREGLTESTADLTHKVLDKIERAPPITPTQLQDRYKELGSVARKAQDGEERLAANIAQERLLQFAENPPPWIVRGGDPAVVGELRNANANWAALKRGENVEKRTITSERKAGATHSGLNLENELRRRLGVLAEPEVRGGFNPREQAAFQKFAEGTYGSNARRWATNFVGGRGGLGALAGATGVGGVGAGQYFGFDPASATGATLLLGLGAAKYSNMAAMQRARELQLMLLARSPYAQAAGGVPGTRVIATQALAAPTLMRLGEE